MANNTEASRMWIIWDGGVFPTKESLNYEISKLELVNTTRSGL